MSDLYFFTENFPYGSKENFIENEILVLAENFDKVYIVPRSKTEGLREIPINCEVINVPEPKGGVKLIILNFGFIICSLFNEFTNSSSKWFFIKNLRKWNSIFVKNISLANEFSKKKKYSKNDFFLSFWMNDWAQSLSYLKKRKKINKFSFKVLGYDIYDERHLGNYLPFRYHNYKYTQKVYAVSKIAQDYIIAKNIFSNKIGLCHLGTLDHGRSKVVKDGVVKIYSCSNIIPLKRVHKIAEILSKVKCNVYWVHQGEGEAINEVLKIVENFPKNIRFHHSKRFKETNDMMRYIKNENFDIMIHLSASEGFGVVQPEALSLGIPVITTNVGAAPEYMTNKLGLLVDVEIEEQTVIDFIEGYWESDFCQEHKRDEIREFWKQNFYFKHVYSKFIEDFKSH